MMAIAIILIVALVATNVGYLWYIRELHHEWRMDWRKPLPTPLKNFGVERVTIEPDVIAKKVAEEQKLGMSALMESIDRYGKSIEKESKQ